MSQRKESRGDDPDELSQYVEEFIRLHDAGKLGSVEEFCARHTGSVRATLQRKCEEILSIKRVLEEPRDKGWQEALGKRIGDFKLLDEIGRGGMGVVYLAEQLSLRRKVALKVLPFQMSLSERQVERFRREAISAARLNHPGIIRVLSVGDEQGMHYLAMEYIKGHTLHKELRDLVAKHSPKTGELLPPGDRKHGIRVAEVIAGVAEALQYAHEHGIIHRDIKPQNILIDVEGRPCIADFGLAKDIQDESITRSGDLAGTPYYMSPEQAMAKRVRVDHRTDVFSLGVIFYEMLALRRPFEGTTSQQVLYEISFREPRPLRSINPRVHRDLEVLSVKALEKNPGHRFQEAGELARELRRFLDGEPIRTRPPSPVEKLRRKVRQHRGLVAASVLVFAALLIGILAGGGPETFRVTIETPGHPDALVSYQVIDVETRMPGEEHAIGRSRTRATGSPAVTGSLPVGHNYRFTVESAGGYGEMTRLVMEPEPVTFTATIRPTSEVVESTEAPMELIEPGTFLFGANNVEVELNAYWIDRYEVSNRMYKRFLDDTGHPRPGIWPDLYDEAWDDLPVAGVSFEDAQAYAEWAGKRLATVFEWEKGARGPDGRLLPWQPEMDPDSVRARANVTGPRRKTDSLEERFEMYLEAVEAVDTRGESASPFGLHHVLGNVSEWTESFFHIRDRQGNPRTSRENRVLMGGSWRLEEFQFRLEMFYTMPDNIQDPDVEWYGFRCAKSVRS